MLLIGILMLVVGAGILAFMNRSDSPKPSTASNACIASNEDINELQKNIEATSKNGGGTVILEPCQYLITEPILLKSNVHLKGAGIDKTVIKLKATLEDGTKNDSKIILTDSGTKDVSISQMTIDGNKQNRRSLINDPHAHSIDLVHVDGFLIDQVKVVNSASASIMLYNSQNGTVQNSTILDSGSNGILALQDTKNLTITNNTIDHTDHQNGIFISYQQGHSSSDILIKNNTVKYAADFGIEVGHIVPDGQEQHRNIQVLENKVVKATNAGIAFRTVSDGVIKDNVIHGYGRNGSYGGDGIFVEGGYNSSGNVEVVDNEVIQTFQSGDANAIFVTGMDGTLIEGNTIEGSRGNGLFVQASVMPNQTPTTDFTEGKRVFHRIRVSKNQFKDNLKNGIHFQGDRSVGNVIEDNTIDGSGEHGIQIANLTAGNGFRMEGNEFLDNSQTSISVYKETDIQLIENEFNSEDKEEYTVALVDVQDVLVQNNSFAKEDIEKALYDENVDNMTLSQNQFVEQK